MNRPLDISNARCVALAALGVVLLSGAPSPCPAQILPGVELPPLVPRPELPQIPPGPIGPGPVDPGEPTFERGDVNDSGTVDISDANALLSFLFLAGDEPPCRKAADTDDSGNVNLVDAIIVLNFLFLGSQAPRPPFGACGVDPTSDDLSCRISTRCSTTPSCPDPAVVELDVVVLRRDPSGTSGRVRITAVVENRGSRFDSRSGQQSLSLYEDGVLVVSQGFIDLDTGDRVMVSRDVEWSTSDEVSPSFRARIDYDPDLYLDGNEDNDDCEPDNNQRRYLGLWIDDLFS